MHNHPFFWGLLFVGFFELFFIFPHRFWLLSIIGIILLVGFISRIHHTLKGRARPTIRAISLLFIIMIASMVLYSSIIEFIWLRHLSSLVFGVFIGMLLQVLERARGDIRERPRALLSTIGLVTLPALFLTSSFFHGLKLFFDARGLWIVLSITILHIIIVWLYFKALNINARVVVPSVFAAALITFEGFWITEFLPLGPLALGLLHSIPLMVLLLIERDRLLDQLRRVSYLRLMSGALSILILILLFSRWS